MQAGPVMQMPVFIVLFFAPVYVPLALLSGWLHAVASVNPSTVLLETGRSLLAGSPEQVALAYLVAFGLAGGFVLWAIRGLLERRAGGRLGVLRDGKRALAEQLAVAGIGERPESGPDEPGVVAGPQAIGAARNVQRSCRRTVAGSATPSAPSGHGDRAGRCRSGPWRPAASGASAPS